MSPDGARQAFEGIKPRLDALGEVQRVNVRLQRVAIFAAAAGRMVRAPEMRARFAELPASAFDIGHVDDLEQAALALWYALVESKRAAVGASHGALDRGLVEEAGALKRRMLQVLAYYLDQDSAAQAELAAIRQGKGYLNLANGLIRLARLYERHADALARDAHRYRAADRADASRVAHAIMHQLGERPVNDAVRWTNYVRRAWTLLARVYEQVSRAGRFLFHDENAEALFPSLVTVARARSRRAPDGEAGAGGGTGGDDTPAAEPEPGLEPGPAAEPGHAADAGFALAISASDEHRHEHGELPLRSKLVEPIVHRVPACLMERQPVVDPGGKRIRRITQIRCHVARRTVHSRLHTVNSQFDLAKPSLPQEQGYTRANRRESLTSWQEVMDEVMELDSRRVRGRACTSQR